MVDTVVVIPTRFQIEPLSRLLGSIVHDKTVTSIMIFDNGHNVANKRLLATFESLNPKIWVIDSESASLYEMWNAGWEYATMSGLPVNVAILNDDCYIHPGSLDVMAHFLRMDSQLGAVYPDYTVPLDSVGGFTAKDFSLRKTKSTFGHGGMSGFCFMVKGELDIPAVDENLRWWYGDDDLVKQLELHGWEIGRVVGLPVEHDPGQSSKFIDVEGMIKADMAYFNQKYGEHRTRW